jgi:hypothetical protein
MIPALKEGLRGWSMKPWIWLRIASVLIALFAAGHTFGHLSSSDATPEQKALTAAKRTFHFDPIALNPTVWDLYSGLSLAMIVNLTLLSVLIWQLSKLARSSAAQARPMVWALVVAQVLMSLVCLTNFFVVPLVLSALATVALLVAAVNL